MLIEQAVADQLHAHVDRCDQPRGPTEVTIIITETALLRILNDLLTMID